MTDIKNHLLNHENHRRIKFYEDEHRYEFFPDLRKSEGIEFDGVTSWISSFSKKKFKPKKVAKAVNDNPNSEYYEMGVDNIIQTWNDRRDKGSAIHKSIEDVVNTGVYDDKMSFYIDRFWEQMDSHGIEPFVSEMVVYDKEIGRATPIDLCGVRKDKLVVMDIKTFRKGMEYMPYGGATFKHPLGDLYDSKYEKVSLQTSIAKKWLIDHYDVPEDAFDEMYVVMLNDDGCEVIPVMDYHNNYVPLMYEYTKTETPPWD